MSRDEDELTQRLVTLGVLPAGPLGMSLREDLDRLPHSSFPTLEDPYHAARVVTTNGQTHSNVSFVSQKNYLEIWGPDPDRDYILPSQVRTISASPNQLPPRYADQIYSHGESGMGFVVFRLGFRDGTHADFSSGGLAEFVMLPSGYTFEDIVGVKFPTSWEEASLRHVPSYYWCVFSP